MKPANRILVLADLNFNTGALKELGSISHVIIRRRSYAIEIDIHTNDPEASEKELMHLGKVMDFRKLSGETIEYTSEYFSSIIAREKELLAEARSMFKEERYWEAHTVLEDLWKAKQGDTKKLLQGIIILAAALTHHQMGEEDVAVKMYHRAIGIINRYGDKHDRVIFENSDFTYPVEFPDVSVTQ